MSKLLTKNSVFWIFQEEGFGGDEKSLISELTQRQLAHPWDCRHPMCIFDYKTNRDASLSGIIGAKSGPAGNPPCVFAYGSIPFIRKVQRETNWIPGTFASFENFDHRVHMTTLKELMFNYGAKMTTLGLFEQELESSRITRAVRSWFIRPDSGMKTFTGQVISNTIRQDSLYDYLGDRNLCASSIIWVAPAKPMNNEYRFVIKAPYFRFNDRFNDNVENMVPNFSDKQEIVAGCLYMSGSDPETPKSTNIPDHVMSGVRDILSKITYAPDRVYVMDIHEDSDGSVSVLELNAISTSGLYCIDPKPVIDAVNEAAVEEWSYYCNV